MKRFLVILAVVVAMFLILVVAPVTVGSSAKEGHSVAPTEVTEAVEMTEATQATIAATAVAETYVKPDASDVSDQVKVEPTEAVSIPSVDAETYPDDDNVTDVLRVDEYPEPSYTESYDINVYSNDTGTYSDGDLELLARLIYAENGCYWTPDWVQLYTGSVVLNRVNSPLYADTIEGVIYEPGQYVPDALYYNTPDARTYENARILLEGGSILPAEVMGQNGFNAGDGTYAVYYDEVLGSTVYFTYVYG